VLRKANLWIACVGSDADAGQGGGSARAAGGIRHGGARRAAGGSRARATTDRRMMCTLPVCIILLYFWTICNHNACMSASVPARRRAPQPAKPTVCRCTVEHRYPSTIHGYSPKKAQSRASKSRDVDVIAIVDVALFGSSQSHTSLATSYFARRYQCLILMNKIARDVWTGRAPEASHPHENGR